MSDKAGKGKNRDDKKGRGKDEREGGIGVQDFSDEEWSSALDDWDKTLAGLVDDDKDNAGKGASDAAADSAAAESGPEQAEQGEQSETDAPSARTEGTERSEEALKETATPLDFDETDGLDLPGLDDALDALVGDSVALGGLLGGTMEGRSSEHDVQEEATRIADLSEEIVSLSRPQERLDPEMFSDEATRLAGPELGIVLAEEEAQRQSDEYAEDEEDFYDVIVVGDEAEEGHEQASGKGQQPVVDVEDVVEERVPGLDQGDIDEAVENIEAEAPVLSAQLDSGFEPEPRAPAAEAAPGAVTEMASESVGVGEEEDTQGPPSVEMIVEPASEGEAGEEEDTQGPPSVEMGVEPAGEEEAGEEEDTQGPRSVEMGVEPAGEEDAGEEEGTQGPPSVEMSVEPAGEGEADRPSGGEYGVGVLSGAAFGDLDNGVLGVGEVPSVVESGLDSLLGLGAEGGVGIGPVGALSDSVLIVPLTFTAEGGPGVLSEAETLALVSEDGEPLYQRDENVVQWQSPSHEGDWNGEVELLVWRDLGDTLAVEAALCEEDQEAARLELACAQVAEWAVGDGEAAMGHYLDACAREPNLLDARWGAVRAYLMSGDLGGVAEQLESLSNSAHPESFERSFVTGLRAELSLQDSDHATALEYLRELGGSQSVQFWKLLGEHDVAAASGDHSFVADRLETMALQQSLDEGGAELLYLSAELRRVLGEGEKAVDCYDKVLQAESSPRLRRDAHHGKFVVLERQERWSDLEEVFGRLADVAEGSESDWWRIRRTKLLARLGRVSESLDVLSGLQEPDRFVSLRARMYEAAGRADEAVALLKEAADREQDSTERAQLLFHAGRVAEDGLGAGPAAATLYREAARMDPGVRAADLGVCRCLMAVESDRAPGLDLLAWAADRRAASKGGALFDAWRARELWALGRLDEAWQTMEQGIDGQPNSLALVIEVIAHATGSDDDKAMGLLRQVVEQGHGPTQLVAEWKLAELQRDWSRLLDDVTGVWAAIRRARRREDLEELYRKEAEHAPLHRSAWLGLRLDDDDREAGESVLMDAAQSSVAGWPATWKLLVRLGAQGRWKEIIEAVHSGAVGGTNAAAEILGLLRSAVFAAWSPEHHQWSAGAGETIQGAPWPSFLWLVATVHQMRGEFDEAATILSGRRSSLDDSTEGHEGDLELESAMEWAGRLDTALELVERFRGGDEATMWTSAWELMQQDLGNWPVLASEAINRLQDADEGDTQTRVNAYEQLVRIDRDGRGEESSAVLAFGSILEAFPGHWQAQRELELYFAADRRWGELASVYRAMAEGVSSNDEREAALMELGRLSQQLADAQSARDAYLAILELRADSIAALKNLEADGRQRRDFDLVERCWAGLAEVVPTHGVTAAAAWTRAAEMAVRKEHFEVAMERFEAALLKHGSYLPAAVAQVRTGLQIESWKDVISGCQKILESSEVQQTRADAALLAGVVAETRLEDDAMAVGFYRHCLSERSEDYDAHVHVCEAYRRMQDWQNLAEQIEERLAVEHTALRKVDLLWELALVWRDHLDDTRGALACVERLLAIKPDHFAALSSSVAFYEEFGQWQQAADAMVRLARLEKDREVLKGLLFRLGGVLEEHLSDPRKAASVLNQVVSLDPNHIEALDRLARIHEDLGEWKAAMAASGRILNVEKDVERKVNEYVRLARILENGYRDMQRAREALRRAVDSGPSNLTAIGELAAFYVRRGDTSSLLVHLDQAATTVRKALDAHALDVDAYRSLQKIFEWRRAGDRAARAIDVLHVLGLAGGEDLAMLRQHPFGAADPAVLVDSDLDDALFGLAVPSGLRQVFRILGGSLLKYYKADLKQYGLTRSHRLTNEGSHPAGRLAKELAASMGVRHYELYHCDARPDIFVVEPADPPMMIIGDRIIEGAEVAELQFMLVRGLKLIQSNMVLPSFLSPSDLAIVVAAVVQQYVTDYDVTGLDPKVFSETSRQVSKILSRRMREELMPFAYECSSEDMKFDAIGRAVRNAGNYVGLLSCGSLEAALRVLSQSYGLGALPDKPEARIVSLRGAKAIEDLLRFMVSDEHFALRRRLDLAR
ncbi:MAG: hypothetical protein J7M25_01270 [Deltaproteobacteria bacterium]|nr:hypothetical protein [Deltaproteobacteria bacterium]